MPGFYLHPSNRLESLVPVFLAKVAKELPEDPMAPIEVIVPGPAVAAWLRRQIAAQAGIAAAIDCRMPGALRAPIYNDTDPQPSLEDTFHWWLLLRLLGPRPDGFPKRFNDSISAGAAAAQATAAKVTTLMSRYARHAPEWLVRWEKPSHEIPSDWQHALWYLFSKDYPPDRRPPSWHPERHLKKLAESLARPGSGPLHLFNLHHLPATDLDLLKSLSTTRTIHWYLTEPSDLDWNEIICSRQAALREIATADTTCNPASALLASWGQLGRAMLSRLLDRDAQLEPGAFYFPDPTDVLRWLQADLRLGTAAGQKRPAPPPESAPPTLILSACAGPRRELEVVHDYLIECARDLPDLQWSEVLILAPDINLYLDLIPAVFGNRTGPDGMPLIPWRGADARPLATAPLAAAFLETLSLAKGRACVNDVLSWLELPILRTRYDFSDADLETLRSWAADLGVCWGIHDKPDAFTERGSPPFNNWITATKRILLSYAFPPRGEPLWPHTPPFEDIEGSRLDLANNLIAAIELLRETRLRILPERTTSEWLEVWRTLVNHLASDCEDETIRDRTLLGEAFDAWLASVPESAANTPIPHDAALASLIENLQAPIRFGGGSSGGVAFASLRPGRPIPARVTCLIGLNERDFPGGEPLPYDRLADPSVEVPRERPPTARENAGQSLLDAVLCTRDRLHISYQHIDPSDLTEMEPSLLLTDLIDYLTRSLGPAAVDRLRRKHPLHSHSAEAFRIGAPPTFDPRAHRAAEVRSRPPVDRPAILSHPLEPTEPDVLSIDTDDFLDWVRQPARWFVRRAIGAVAERDEDLLPDSEPFSLNALRRYTLLEKTLSDSLSQQEETDALCNMWERFRHSGHLPLAGTRAGDDLLADLRHEFNELRDRALEQLPIAPPETVRIDTSLEVSGRTVRITGPIRNVRDKVLVRVRPANAKPAHSLELWVALHLLAHAGLSLREAVLFTLEGTSRLTIPESPQLVLAVWIQAFLNARFLPAPYLPKTSWEYAKAAHHLLGQNKRVSPEEAAESVFVGSEISPGECKEPGVSLLFPNSTDLIGSRAFIEFAISAVQPAAAALMHGK